MEEEATGGLTPVQRHQLEAAIAEVVSRTGWGEVRIIIQWRRPHSIIVSSQHKIDNLKTE